MIRSTKSQWPERQKATSGDSYVQQKQKQRTNPESKEQNPKSKKQKAKSKKQKAKSKKQKAKIKTQKAKSSISTKVPLLHALLFLHSFVFFFFFFVLLRRLRLLPSSSSQSQSERFRAAHGTHHRSSTLDHRHRLQNTTSRSSRRCFPSRRNAGARPNLQITPS
jgi:DNA mismatch repair ATPase MutL